MEERQHSCVICFQTSNNNSERSDFIELRTTDCESKTYLDKLQYLTNYDIVSISIHPL